VLRIAVSIAFRWASGWRDSWRLTRGDVRARASRVSADSSANASGSSCTWGSAKCSVSTTLAGRVNYVGGLPPPASCHGRRLEGASWPVGETSKLDHPIRFSLSQLDFVGFCCQLHALDTVRLTVGVERMSQRTPWSAGGADPTTSPLIHGPSPSDWSLTPVHQVPHPLAPGRPGRRALLRR
jgi:hypothetical protein